MKFLVQNMTRRTKNASKTDYFQKVWSNCFLNENIFFRINFSKNAQKSQHWRLYGVYWPAKLFFESQFSKEFWFSNNTFSIENWCVVNILTQVLTLCGNQFKLWREVFYFSSKTWSVAKKLLTFLIKIWLVVKRMFQNLTCCKISVSENDELIKVD